MREPSVLDETFEALVFDWDGTAVPDRSADASVVRQRLEALCAAGVHLFVVSGTHVDNVDGQLLARPWGRGRLHLCLNRGSEVFEVDENGPALVYRRSASAEEDAALDRAADLTLEALQARGLRAAVVSSRLNRRKIDLIPVPEWNDPKKADIAQLAQAVRERLAGTGVGSLADAVGLATEVARKAGLSDPRITSDVKHVEIGLTDKSDSARFAATWLADRGITGQLVLLGGDELGSLGGVPGSDSLMLVEPLARAVVVSVGVEPGGVPDGVVHVGGGPTAFIGLLDAQLSRRADHRVPQVDADERWVLPLPTSPAKARVAEALGTLGNGSAATRGSMEEGAGESRPLFAVSGTYTDDHRLLAGPIWTALDLSGSPHRGDEPRLIDLRSGVLVRGQAGPSGVRPHLRSLRLVSAASVHTMALRVEGPARRIQPGEPLRPPRDGEFGRSVVEGACVARTGRAPREIAVAARDYVANRQGRRTVERLASWSTDTAGECSVEDRALHLLAEAETLGFDALLAEHRAAWAGLWRDAEVTIEGDDRTHADQLAARFSVFHLLAAAAPVGEAAVGARGLTGDAYSGHVFWDADVFVLPALTAIRPSAARAMLEYRLRRLPAARRAAAALGGAGARFPWESADNGTDVTPALVRGGYGEIHPIRTGSHEEHIVADVAWAAAHYANWCGDRAFIEGPGRSLLVDTARYWASRVRLDERGHGHIYGVMGPDEYHEVVDDNAYTNVMARWNLRQGAEALKASGWPEERHEAAEWRSIAARLVDGWSPEHGVYEQFAGYFGLEPLLVSEFSQPPVAIDVLLGPQRVSSSQLIKQADVLMLHHLVPGDVRAGSLRPCLDFYEPHTAHGSSLSPAIHASLLARAGRPDQALEFFRMASRLDLDDLTGTTSGGVHLATMGGVWQALAFGFLGLRAGHDALIIDPRLPAAWSTLSLRLRFRGRRICIRATHDELVLECDAPLRTRIRGSGPVRCDSPGATFELNGPGPPTQALIAERSD